MLIHDYTVTQSIMKQWIEIYTKKNGKDYYMKIVKEKTLLDIPN